MRSEGESALAQSERERQTLSQALSSAQREAQHALHSATADHQEELERLASEKVRETEFTELTSAIEGPTLLPSRFSKSASSDITGGHVHLDVVPAGGSVHQPTQWTVATVLIYHTSVTRLVGLVMSEEADLQNGL